jgi:hypothetical protein
LGFAREMSQATPTSTSTSAAAAFRIRKNDAKYLSRCQVKKAQFLFENDYFIWNEAELYLRFHDIFTTLGSSVDTDLLYENVCRTTRIVFNLIHDVHFAGTGSNAAHLKFFEVLVRRHFFCSIPLVFHLFQAIFATL